MPPLLAAALLLASAQAATIGGVVVENRSGRPLARAKVTLTQKGQVLSALAGDNGQFRFSEVGAGAWTLAAERAGFFKAQYGQKKWNGPGTPIMVDPERIFTAELRLSRPAAITGTVSDRNQVGIPSQTVVVYRAGRSPRPAASAVTDDRGVYRVSGLSPGRYYVRTAARPLSHGYSLLPVFYGQAPGIAGARYLDLDLDQEVGDINIQVEHGRLCKISGVVVWPDRPAQVSVTLFSEANFAEQSQNGAGGFRFEQLPPGAYDLVAESRGSVPLAGHQRLVIGGDMEGLTVEMLPPPVLEVSFADRDGGQIDTRLVTVVAKRGDPLPGESRLVWPAPEPVRLTPGRWEIEVVPSSNLYVVSVQGANSPGLTWNEVLVRPGRSASIAVTLSSRGGKVSGTVRRAGAPAPEATVFLEALDAQAAERLGGIRRASTNPEGNYVFMGLPPGQYRLVSAALSNPSPEALEAAGGKVIQIAEAADELLDLEEK
ncbi:MAG: carboxypeptidase-like regulatory domain-containing protein [Bryobacteraceae bacterium]